MKRSIAERILFKEFIYDFGLIEIKLVDKTSRTTAA
jgi:hypothetical protein